MSVLTWRVPYWVLLLRLSNYCKSTLWPSKIVLRHRNWVKRMSTHSERYHLWKNAVQCQILFFSQMVFWRCKPLSSSFHLFIALFSDSWPPNLKFQNSSLSPFIRHSLLYEVHTCWTSYEILTIENHVTLLCICKTSKEVTHLG